ncbi:hypothetical protein [Methanolobus bombayensis]|jgi:hypothetical protein|uniref:hypothetical protein n=1 Tax=Methanolobus bombayensis TaxID=38023 RepID=UPI001AE57412|nr:hypothetical protein [Methanolobus bombayensis]MBP1908275.1 hypothetical protein [Methanolobus bombayensis]
MESLDIYAFGQYLSTITVENIHETMHFRKRIETRFGEEFSKEVYHTIFDCTPVGILQQNEQKFKVLYRYNEDYDLIIIFGVKDLDPIQYSLVTCFKEASKRRMRDDERAQD